MRSLEKGDYVIYVEFAPEGKADEVHRFDLPVGGGGSSLGTLTPDLSPKQVGDYTASITDISDWWARHILFISNKMERLLPT